MCLELGHLFSEHLEEVMIWGGLFFILHDRGGVVVGQDGRVVVQFEGQLIAVIAWRLDFLLFV